MGKMPEFRVVVKTGDKFWEDIGAAWTKEDKLSVQLNVAPIPQNGKINFLLVPNGSAKAQTQTNDN